jgi:hypothetical protein
MKLSPEYRAKLKKLAFESFTSIVCDLMAYVFFFWADWRIGVGYGFVWLSEMTSSQAMQTALTPSQAKEILDEVKKEFRRDE